MAGYVPIVRVGHLLGLVAAEFDEASPADFHAIVRTSFLKSVVPAILISLVIAFVLASMFVRPKDVFREIEETAESQRARTPDEEKADPWHQLTPREIEIAELLGQGTWSHKDLAQALSVGEETIKTHLKNIKVKTGWSKHDLAMQALARRTAFAPATT